MLPSLGLLLIVVPIIELWVIVTVGDRIGVLNTLALLILVSIVGAVMLKREGTATWRRLRATIERGEMPTAEVTDGAMVLFGGALLLTPGFVTDAVGFLFLFPGTRAATKSAARRVLGALVLRRVGAAGTAASAGKRIYDTRATRTRRASEVATEPTPSAPPRLPAEDDSPDRG